MEPPLEQISYHRFSIVQFLNLQWIMVCDKGAHIKYGNHDIEFCTDDNLQRNKRIISNKYLVQTRIQHVFTNDEYLFFLSYKFCFLLVLFGKNLWESSLGGVLVNPLIYFMTVLQISSFHVGDSKMERLVIEYGQ